MEIYSTPVNIDSDGDPTGTFIKDEFILFRFWTHGYKREQMPAITGIPLGTVKLHLINVFVKLDDATEFKGNRNKRSLIHLAWKRGIYTLHNCHLPLPHNAYHNLIVKMKNKKRKKP